MTAFSGPVLIAMISVGLVFVFAGAIGSRKSLGTLSAHGHGIVAFELARTPVPVVGRRRSVRRATGHAGKHPAAAPTPPMERRLLGTVAGAVRVGMRVSQVRGSQRGHRLVRLLRSPCVGVGRLSASARSGKPALCENRAIAGCRRTQHR